MPLDKREIFLDEYETSEPPAKWASERYRHKQTKRASEQEPEYPEPDGYDDPNR